MDRQIILDITRGIHSERLSLEDMHRVVVEYCIEKGKDSTLSYKLGLYLINHGLIMEPFSIALEYFQKKFSICTLTDVKGRVITVF